MVHYAAAELRAYTQKITGVMLPIEKVGANEVVALDPQKSYVLVGESPYTRALGVGLSEVKPDGFHIVTGGNHLAIVGRDYGGPPLARMRHGLGWTHDPKTGVSHFGETGTLYGVYHFLETFCGIRWFMPGPLGEVVPQQTTLTIPDVKISRAPFVRHRQLLAYYLFRADQEHVRWYKRAGFGADHVADVEHSFGQFDAWAKEHPEWFYLDANGKPDPHLYLCLTEPAVVRAVVSHIRTYFDEHPNNPMFPLMPKDYPVIPDLPEEQMTDARFKGRLKPEMGPYGKCSDHLWQFVDQVAREVYTTHPGRLISCCAYNMYRVPPPSIEKLSPNVAVMICHMTANYYHQGQDAQFEALVQQWHRRSRHIYFWNYASHYYIGFAMPGTPVNYPRLIARDFSRLKGMLGSDWQGTFFEAESGRPQVRKFINREMCHLTYYVFGKCLWEPDLDIEALLDDYYAKFFGPAREPMKRYYDLSEKLYAEKTAKHDCKGWHYYAIGFFLEFTREEAEQLVGCLEEAKTLAGDTVYGERVTLILESARRMLREPPVKSDFACVPAPKPDGPVKEDGLVAYWNFDEGDGKIVRDATGNRSDGLVVKAKWLNTRLGSALHFNGVDSYVEIRYPRKELAHKKALTLMAWFYPEELPVRHSGLIWTYNYAYLLGFHHVVTFLFYKESGGIGGQAQINKRELVVPGWNHLAGTYDGRRLRLYLNGELKADLRAGGNIRYTGDGKPWKLFKDFRISIGASNAGTKYQKTVKGRIDEVKIYSRPLSEDDIRRAFLEGKAALEAAVAAKD